MSEHYDPLYVKDCNVLILGGGTSTLDTKWENLPYDRIWTCNDFYLEPRLLDVQIDLFLAAFTTDYSSQVLIDKMKKDQPYLVVEPTHMRGKQDSKEFIDFWNACDAPMFIKEDLPNILPKDHPGSKSGAMFRLIQLALALEAKNVWFAGFDGFNKEFSNKHAFTKHVGLKETDTRRDWDGTEMSYVNVFTQAYKALQVYPNHKVLQNLGEGFDYNLGTLVSKQFFPLKKEIYEIIR